MITQVSIENFKKLENISFSLSSSVVIVGPNNSGKSTIFQALCLWEIGVRKFIAARKKEGDYVTINRRDLLSSPILDTRYLWNGQKVTTANGRGRKHIPLMVELRGETRGRPWACKVEFLFANAESFSCRVLTGLPDMKWLYEHDAGIHFGFLQPMSGISTSEDKLTQGSIDRKLGEGRTAEVLRNICFEILYPELKANETADMEARWKNLCKVVKDLFGVTLKKPELIKSTGLLHLDYTEDGVTYDIAAGGRGFQQTLLLFAYMFANPHAILLLDEPDAHLEAIRQGDVFRMINEVAEDTGTQVIMASHSEVVLNRAATTSKAIALIENRVVELNVATGSQPLGYIRKALTDIGWDKYYLARSKGHVLYLEGDTDFRMLLGFASRLRHEVEPLLRKANVQYTSNNVPNDANKNYAALKGIFPELNGLALFDRIEKNIADIKPLKIICWQRRELENYFARPELLYRHAKQLANPYSQFSAEDLERTMREVVADYTLPAYLKDKTNDWWNDAKLSDEWLDKIFPEFYKRLGIPTGGNFKRDYYRLIELMDKNDVPAEVREKLDTILELLRTPPSC
ncbi:MAG: AAA family ATPase [Mediterranea sp.]|jgi:energy-coupling factor transporter ATP-binding protein EcfA2|nr:AAA family ATPase [Mediterranea sp.]